MRANCYKLAELRAILIDKKAVYTYTELEMEYKVNRFYLWHIINDPAYEPKRASIRFRLGLPALVPAPVCRHCGQPHPFIVARES